MEICNRIMWMHRDGPPEIFRLIYSINNSDYNLIEVYTKDKILNSKSVLLMERRFQIESKNMNNTLW